MSFILESQSSKARVKSSPEFLPISESHTRTSASNSPLLQSTSPSQPTASTSFLATSNLVKQSNKSTIRLPQVVTSKSDWAHNEIIALRDYVLRCIDAERKTISQIDWKQFLNDNPSVTKTVAQCSKLSLDIETKNLESSDEKRSKWFDFDFRFFFF